MVLTMKTTLTKKDVFVLVPFSKRLKINQIAVIKSRKILAPILIQWVYLACSQLQIVLGRFTEEIKTGFLIK